MLSAHVGNSQSMWKAQTCVWVEWGGVWRYMGGTHTQTYMCLWKSEVNSKCLSLFHLAFQDGVSQWTWNSLMQLDLDSSQTSGTHRSLLLQYCKHEHPGIFFASAWDKIQVLMLEWQTLSWLSHLPSPVTELLMTVISQSCQRLYSSVFLFLP